MRKARVTARVALTLAPDDDQQSSRDARRDRDARLR
jgi:hypothetical protein